MSLLPSPKPASGIIDVFFFDDTAPKWLKDAANEQKDDEGEDKDEKGSSLNE